MGYQVMMTGSLMDHQSRRQLLHDIRGRMNGLQLCVAALETTSTPSEQIEFLDDIDRLCDKLDRLLGKLEAAGNGEAAG